MKLINLKCPNCNANVEVNENLDEAYCNYCGTKFKVEDENETKEERIIKTKARMEEKAKKSDREYYASEDYAKKLDIEANANDKSLFGSIARQIQNSRNYYSSDEYKKRIEIQNEQSKQAMKALIPIVAVSILSLTIIPIVLTFTDTSNDFDDMTCTINDFEYVIVIKSGEKITCASCDDEMLNELNSKYLNSESVQLTKKNIKSYFDNKGGNCKG